MMPIGLFTALSHPEIDPVLLSIGPFQVHWYGMAYVAGILFAWWWAKKLVSTERLWGFKGSPITTIDIDDFLVWAVVGIILGGRIGYVLFYDLPTYLANPASVFAVWQGGMAFHGGLAGTIVAMILFTRSRGFSVFSLFDVIGSSACIGLFLGRVANFINSELYGKVSDVPWAVIFPGSDGQPRHPSQLYEGALEGLLLFAVLAILIWKFEMLKRPGFIGGLFIAGYAVSRILVEFVRVPDVQLGYLAGGWLTMGMVLSVPILLIGVWSIITSRGRATL